LPNAYAYTCTYACSDSNADDEVGSLNSMGTATALGGSNIIPFGCSTEGDYIILSQEKKFLSFFTLEELCN
jgi:hypothetical protein